MKRPLSAILVYLIIVAALAAFWGWAAGTLIP